MATGSRVQLDRARTFLRELELPPLPEGLVFRDSQQLSAPTDGQSSAYINAGSVVSFVSGVSSRSQTDVLNTTLLAQLAANKKFDRETDTVNWYKFYRSVLENVGWVLQDFDFTEYSAEGRAFEMDQAVLTILAAVAAQNEFLVIKAAIEAAKRLADKNDGRIALFDAASSRGTKGAFQLGVATESNSVVAMKLGAFYFSTSTAITKVLWFKFSSNQSSLYQSSQSVTLDSGVYANVRSNVEQKLGDRTKQFLASLEL
jgi:predicted DCC family thiol-disulfide oxidoreductase YuxK